MFSRIITWPFEFEAKYLKNASATVWLTKSSSESLQNKPRYLDQETSAPFLLSARPVRPRDAVVMESRLTCLLPLPQGRWLLVSRYVNPGPRPFNAPAREPRAITTCFAAAARQLQRLVRPFTIEAAIPD